MAERDDPRVDSSASARDLTELLFLLRLPEAARIAPPRTLTGAAVAGDPGLVAAFLDAGAETEESSIGFASPLQAAAGAGHLEVVALLLARGADPREKPGRVYSPLGAAVMHGHADVFERLLSALPDLSGERSAIQEAVTNGRAEWLRRLLERGASLGEHAGHLLRIAARQGHFACVKVLLEAGVDPDEHPDYHRDSFGDTVETPCRPRDVAREQGHHVIVQLLEGRPFSAEAIARAEATPGTSPAEALRSAAASLSRALGSGKKKASDAPALEGAEREAAVRAAVERIRTGELAGRLDATDGRGRTPLTWAAEGGETLLVDALIEAGAQPAAPNVDGTTPLHEAARWGRRAAVMRLLEAGADPNVRSEDKETPLMAAAAWGDLEIVRHLLAAGADPEARMRGKSARGFASGLHRSAIRALVDEYSARKPR